MALAFIEFFPFCGRDSIALINTSKNVIQIVASDNKRKETGLDWGRSMENLSGETVSELREEQKSR